MKVEEFWPALETTALIWLVAIRREALAATWQVPDRLVATIGDHGFVFGPGGPTDAAHRELAAIGAADAVIQGIARIRKIRIGLRSRNPSRGGLFRGIRKIRSQGA
jgi:hypothetical protein